MTELEKVEKLREKVEISFTEAKEALDIAGGDILDALIYLESQGRSTIPAGGGYFSEAPAYDAHTEWQGGSDKSTTQNGESFRDMMKRFGRFCLKILNKGNTNFLDAYKGDALMFCCPVTGLVVLLLFFFWVVIPMFVISLFLGIRYRFRGDDLGRDSVNRIMDNASNVAEDVKKSFNDGRRNINEES